jgi:hypothetical protein
MNRGLALFGIRGERILRVVNMRVRRRVIVSEHVES